jgi:two-component system, chemotaxis family, sensor kinase CheA
MNTSSDISKEELDVFLEEADEQLQLLDESFVTLEKKQGNSELLQEIFRAAHTLKGSSAMVGYEAMSRVAHVMETILDRVRNRTLAVNTQIINGLLYGLDALKSLRSELTSGGETNVDVKSVVAVLEKIINEGGLSVSSQKAKTTNPDTKIVDNPKTAVDKGQNAYAIKVELDPNSSWGAVRCFQVVNQLSGMGKIVDCIPSQKEIESGDCGHSVKLNLATSEEAGTIKNSLATVPDIVNIEVNLKGLEDIASSDDSDVAGSKEQDDASSTSSPGATSQKPVQISQTVRVDVKLLDSLMNLVGEMVIDRNRVGQISRVLQSRYKGDETVRALEEIYAHLTKVVSELHENILKARMLPIGTICNGFPRMVRDLAQKAQKQIDFVIEGRETELDRSIIEQIKDPLIHLLRNAVDHGIENPDERKSIGKVEKGLVRLLAFQEQNHIVIVVEDDGKGINAKAIKEAAIKKGFVTEKEAAGLDDNEALDLVFASGISTAIKITEISGRGVGLDVVRTNVEALGGSVKLETKDGQGTKFTVRLPLTLMTINGFLVSSDNTTYVIPMASMVEVLRLDPKDMETVMGRQVIKVRDKVFPLLKLDKEFVKDTVETNQSAKTLVTIIKAGEKNIALAVDSVREPQEVVVKSMGKYIGGVRGVTGATILGDGRVALIIDAPTMAREAIGC